jgi:catechol 2,3-dioxygenase-like lactoylglutathione lyase family enzyme
MSVIDHLELQTRQPEAAARFYATLLAPLGYRQTVDGLTKGFRDERGLDLFIVEGEPSVNVHFAFTAPSRAIVDEIYEIGCKTGFHMDRAPALAAHVHPNYYAGYVRDPDGRLVEFTCHAP